MKRHSFAQFLRVVTEGTPEQDAAAAATQGQAAQPQVPELRKADQGIMNDFHRLRDAVIAIKEDWERLQTDLQTADTSMQKAGVSWTAQINSMRGLQKAYVTLAERYNKSKLTIKTMAERHVAAIEKLSSKMETGAKAATDALTKANQTLLQIKQDEIEALQEEMESLAQSGDENLEAAKQVMSAFEQKIAALNTTIAFLQQQNARYVKELQVTSRFVHDAAAQAAQPAQTAPAQQNAHHKPVGDIVMEYLQNNHDSSKSWFS